MRIRGSIIFVFLCCAGAVPLRNHATAQNIIFVDQSAIGFDDGSSWVDAFVFLQDALAAAQAGDEIWVANGTYTPDQGVGIERFDRSARFQITPGVSIYGGFSGSELSRNERDWVKNKTILSGDLAQNDNGNIERDEPSRQDNSSSVIVFVSNAAPITLDGLIIAAGHAWDSSSTLGEQGGGLLLEYRWSIRNLIVRDNYAALSGGGAFLFSSEHGTNSIVNTRFINNHAEKDGGGLRISGESTTLRDVVFEENQAMRRGGGIRSYADLRISDVQFYENTAVEGGAFFTTGTTYIVNAKFFSNQALVGGAIAGGENNFTTINSLFHSNWAREVGGAIDLFQAQSIITNSTFSSNIATRGGAISVGGQVETRLIQNSILWNNDAVEDGTQVYFFSKQGVPSPLTLANTLIEGGLDSFMIDGGGNLSVDPLFVDPIGNDRMMGTIDDDYRLSIGSPAIDSGSNRFVPVDQLDIDRDLDFSEILPGDIDKNLRIFGGLSDKYIVDMGAYEHLAPAIEVSVVTLPNEKAYSDVVIFPNPTSGRVTIKIRPQQFGHLVVSVIDLLGREVITVEQGDVYAGDIQSIPLDLSKLASGTYIVSAKTRLEHRLSLVVVIR